MTFVDDRTYVGRPGERATVATTLQNGGALSATLDDAPVANNLSFPLGADGSERVLVLTLVGPEGASCTVRISTVDGATDVDRLECRPAVPAPVHEYHFMASAAEAMPAAAVAGPAAVPIVPPVMAAGAAAERRGTPTHAPRAAKAARPVKKAAKRSAKKVVKRTARKAGAPRKPVSGRARVATQKKPSARTKKASRKSAKASAKSVKKAMVARATKQRRASTGKRGRK